MITCVETLSRPIFPIHKKTLRLSAAWWVACLLLNMMTLGDQSESCRTAGGGGGVCGRGNVPTRIYIITVFLFSKMAAEGNASETDREQAVN